MTWIPDGDQWQMGAESMLTVRVEVDAAQAVYLLAPFNNWSTTATPMRRMPSEAWESVLPTQEVARLAFFVWWSGQRKGQLLWGGDGVAPRYRPLEGGGGWVRAEAISKVPDSIHVDSKSSW